MQLQSLLASFTRQYLVTENELKMTLIVPRQVRTNRGQQKHRFPLIPIHLEIYSRIFYFLLKIVEKL